MSILETQIEEIIPKDQKLITVEARDPLPKAFKILVENNIWSAPVFESEKREYIGFIDLIDIVLYLVEILDNQKNNLGKVEQTFSEEQDFYTLLEQVEKFDLTVTDAIAGISKRNPMCPIRRKATVLEACRIFANTHVHKLPILSSPWHLAHVLSQLDVIQWLSENEEKLPNFGKQTLKETEIGIKPVISVSLSTSAKDAFKEIVKQKISAVAVVDSNGVLVANFSAKDIKKIEEDALFTRVQKNIKEYLTLTKPHEKPIQLPAPIYCTLDSTLFQAIQALAKHRIHRVYVVNHKSQPVGVISLIDVIMEFIKYCEANLHKTETPK